MCFSQCGLFVLGVVVCGRDETWAFRQLGFGFIDTDSVAYLLNLLLKLDNSQKFHKPEELFIEFNTAVQSAHPTLHGVNHQRRRDSRGQRALQNKKHWCPLAHDSGIEQATSLRTITDVTAMNTSHADIHRVSVVLYQSTYIWTYITKRWTSVYLL